MRSTCRHGRDRDACAMCADDSLSRVASAANGTADYRTLAGLDDAREALAAMTRDRDAAREAGYLAADAIERLTGERDAALARAEAAEAKAAQYERDWYDAKAEFGTSMSKMNGRLRDAEREVEALREALAIVEGGVALWLDPQGTEWPCADTGDLERALRGAADDYETASYDDATRDRLRRAADALARAVEGHRP